jgi:hypothetical protein
MLRDYFYAEDPTDGPNTEEGPDTTVYPEGMNEAFKRLYRLNPDIRGWLTFKTEGDDLFEGTIDNPVVQSDRELIVFRDSYASPLLPLIAQAYRTVYVVDIRNVLPGALGGLLEFEGKDVLFLYSATVLDSGTFK